MTKTKQQLRAEAVERLTELNEHGYWKFPVHVALCGRDVPNVDEERTIIADLLTDDCGPCYSCAKLAELVAENSQLRVKCDELEAERGQWREAAGNAHEMWEQAATERDELKKLVAQPCGDDEYWVRTPRECFDGLVADRTKLGRIRELL